MANEIEIYRGDTSSITVTVTDSSGAAYDLTSYTMRMTVKNNKTDSDADAVISKTATISAPATGVGTFDLTTTDTSVAANDYYYDDQINQSTTVVKTVAAGTFTIKEDVTKSTS